MRNPWSRLDNAAKIFPPAESKQNTQVFRFSCELYEDVDGARLQTALDETVRVFDVYQCILRRGLFWYYFENTEIKPVVREEYKPPCAKLYDRTVKGLLYEVTYYKKRINLEIYHALSDGTGAMHFLRSITARYLASAHGIPTPPLDYTASASQMSSDSFDKYYSEDAEKKKKEKQPTAAALRGARLPEGRVKVLTGSMSVKAVLEAAHRYDATLTAFLGGCLVWSVANELPVRARKKPVVIGVPVNLRRFFPSESARNFFCVVNVSCGPELLTAPLSLPEIVRSFDAELKDKLTKEKLAGSMNSYSSVERNFFARMAPLFFKDIVLKIAYLLTARRVTATLSNVGRVTLPPELAEYVRSFNVFNNTGKLQGCACSWGDRLEVSFTSPFVSSEVERGLFRTLADMGIDVEITANSYEE